MPDSKVYVYVLRLEGSRYYIGSTLDIEQRFQDHLNGSEHCAIWPSLYRPEKIIFVEECNSDIDALQKEIEYTAKYVILYGYTKVRGSYFCKYKPSEDDVNNLMSNVHYTSSIRESSISV